MEYDDEELQHQRIMQAHQVLRMVNDLELQAPVQQLQIDSRSPSNPNDSNGLVSHEDALSLYYFPLGNGVIKQPSIPLSKDLD